VRTLGELALRHTDLKLGDLEHLQSLVSSWRILADLSFSDLLLMAPLSGDDADRFVVLAQLRPTTGQTLYATDLVGSVVGEAERPLVAKAWRGGALVVGDAPILGSAERVRVHCIPVRRRDHVVGVLVRESTTRSTRRHGDLERIYQETFDHLARMVAEGTFPFPSYDVEPQESPRVGDGAIVLDATARIRFASPNAVSHLHRIGIHAYTPGLQLSEVGFAEEAVMTALSVKLPVTEEIERGETSILLRVIPLLGGGEPTGALILLRDVTDLRSRDRMLLSKDATIREIHHRVKNNLQTIAALLRLQRRRLRSDESRQALLESERRIRSIAIVHETLAREPGGAVRFDDIVRPLLRAVEEALTSPDRRVRFEVKGTAGEIPDGIATPLAVVLNELVQNAVDHAFPEPRDPLGGRVVVELTRTDGTLALDVSDDGIGLPEGFVLEDSTGLGLTIVQALVTGELGGTIEMSGGDGTHVHVEVPVALPEPTAP